MNAHEVIESYVVDVALLLPRKQRDDVACELRALLHEELQAKADAAGRSADAAMATELLRAFGPPLDVAARYRPTLTIIDPADGHTFLRASVIGLAVIWAIGLIAVLQQPIGTGLDLLTPLSQWWVGTVIPSLWWPGLLVVGLGISAHVRRRWPKASTWKPRAADRIHGGRAAKVLALVGILCGLFILRDPRWVLDVFWGGRAAPAAYEALTYTETFRERQAPWLFGLLLLNIPIFIAVIVMGRWPTSMRRIETGFALATCAVMAWTIWDGPVLQTQAGDRMVKFILALIILYVLLDVAWKRLRRITPAPRAQL